MFTTIAWGAVGRGQFLWSLIIGEHGFNLIIKCPFNFPPHIMQFRHVHTPDLSPNGEKIPWTLIRSFWISNSEKETFLIESGLFDVALFKFPFHKASNQDLVDSVQSKNFRTTFSVLAQPTFKMSDESGSLSLLFVTIYFKYHSCIHSPNFIHYISK